METKQKVTNKSIGLIVLLLLYISGLEFIILTSLFPTIILEKNYIKDFNVHIIIFFISFLVSFNVFSKSGIILNTLSVILNILSSVGLYFENHRILFILCYSVKGIAIGSNLSLAFYILSKKKTFEIENIKKRIISVFVIFSIISGCLFSILIKWINWKFLYLCSIPFSVCLLILTLTNKKINKFKKSSHIFNIDYSGILILYSYVICIYLLNEAYFEESWKYYLIQFLLPGICGLFFFITELLYKDNAILPIKFNPYYFLCFCFGYIFLMDTNKLSFLIQLIHEYSVIKYEIYVAVLCLFGLFLITTSVVFREINRHSPIICISLGVLILVVNCIIFETFNIVTSDIMIITFLLLNTIAFFFLMTNLYLIIKYSKRNKDEDTFKILRNLIGYYTSGKILNLTVNHILYKQFYEDYARGYFGEFYENLKLDNLKRALSYFHDIIRDVYYDTTRKCNIYIALSGFLLLLIAYIFFLLSQLKEHSEGFRRVFTKLTNLCQDITEGLINYYDSFSDSNSKNLSDYLYNAHKEYKNKQTYPLYNKNEDMNTYNYRRNSKLYHNLESGSIFDVKYPNNFVKVYNENLYKPVNKKTSNKNSEMANNMRSSLFESENENVPVKRNSLQSIIDLGRKLSSIDLRSPIRNSVNLGNKIKSPIQAHINPLLNRLNLMYSPHANDSSRHTYSSSSYQELSDDDNEYDVFQDENEIINGTNNINRNRNGFNYSYNNNIDNKNNHQPRHHHHYHKSINNINNDYYSRPYIHDLRANENINRNNNRMNNYLNDNQYLLLNSGVKINSKNPFYNMEVKKNKSTMDYSTNNNISTVLLDRNRNSKINKFKSDPLFFDVSKLNKHHKEYCLRNDTLNKPYKNRNQRMPLNNNSLYEERMMMNNGFKAADQHNYKLNNTYLGNSGNFNTSQINKSFYGQKVNNNMINNKMSKRIIDYKNDNINNNNNNNNNNGNPSNIINENFYKSIFLNNNINNNNNLNFKNMANNKRNGFINNSNFNLFRDNMNNIYSGTGNINDVYNIQRNNSNSTDNTYDSYGLKKYNKNDSEDSDDNYQLQIIDVSGNDNTNENNNLQENNNNNNNNDNNNSIADNNEDSNENEDNKNIVNTDSNIINSITTTTNNNSNNIMSNININMNADSMTDIIRTPNYSTNFIDSPMNNKNYSSYGSSCSDIIENAINIKNKYAVSPSALRNSLNTILSANSENQDNNDDHDDHNKDDIKDDHDNHNKDDIKNDHDDHNKDDIKDDHDNHNKDDIKDVSDDHNKDDIKDVSDDHDKNDINDEHGDQNNDDIKDIHI